MRTARVPMGGWAEEGQGVARHHGPLPEESSEDEMPPHIHKVNMAVCADLLGCNFSHLFVTARKNIFLFSGFHFRSRNQVNKQQLLIIHR